MDMIEEIEYKGIRYPIFQSREYSSQYIVPVALKVCTGIGYDIGCKKREWSLPGSIPIDLCFNNGFHALNLPRLDVDYIFSSHCLEHLDDWIEALEFWVDALKSTGTLFLYLPHYDQEYWRPWNNRKHKHILTSPIICEVLKNTSKMHKIHFSERDINHSFVVMGEKI